MPLGVSAPMHSHKAMGGAMPSFISLAAEYNPMSKTLPPGSFVPFTIIGGML
jgi:hypothetical protein